MATKVVVLGGGIGGLTAAQELVERGFDVAVYEAKPNPGGKSRTIPVPNSGTGGRADLPGEHGFRFFPAFYRHLPDSMKRIPFGDNRHGCFDNLTATSRIEIASYGTEPVLLPSRFPRSLADLVLILKDMFDTDIGLEPGELEFFAERLWQVMTSCDERRLHELEKQSWWDFTDAANKSEAYQKYLAEGLSRSLVAAKAEEGSARTIGQVQVHLAFGVADLFASSTDRVLDGPTSPQLLYPWIAHIRDLGGTYETPVKVTDIAMANGRIESVGLENTETGETSRVSADYYVLSVPVEVMGPLVTDDMVTADPSLATLRTIDTQVRWMNGIQFFLKEDVTITHGHVLYVDSPWAITSISEAQFWDSLHLENYGDGTVKGILSVDISDWTTKGNLIEEPAQDLDEEQIAKEVWYELEQSINVDGKQILSWDNVAGYFLDTDIVIPHPNRPHKDINLEPLFINQPDSWEKRPRADTAIENLLLAADYVQTNSDLACMEAANEAARRAVNAILVRTGSGEKPCKIYKMGMPFLLEPWRIADQRRYDQGLPWTGELLARDQPARATFSRFKDAMLRRAKDLVGGHAPEGLTEPDPDDITLADDAFHLAEYEEASHLFWYTEWWYFNFYDKVNDRAGMVTFATFNASDQDLIGIASLNAAFFDPNGQGSTLEMDYHGISEFWASAEQADVDLAGSTIRVIDADTYEVQATTEDGAISMGLVFKQADVPQMLASNVQGDRPWEISSWLVYMPSAVVNGWVTVHGTRYDFVDATGYHDHDWGIWYIPGNTWAWAAFNEPGQQISFDVGLHAAFQKSTAYFRYKDLRLSFPQESFQSEFSDWKRWKLLWKYPQKIEFTAVDSTGEYKLTMVWEVQDNVTLWKYPLLVFEQTARFVGSLLHKVDGVWMPVVAFDTPGFSEYTSEWIGGGPSDGD